MLWFISPPPQEDNLTIANAFLKSNCMQGYILILIPHLVILLHHHWIFRWLQELEELEGPIGNKTTCQFKQGQQMNLQVTLSFFSSLLAFPKIVDLIRLGFDSISKSSLVLSLFGVSAYKTVKITNFV